MHATTVAVDLAKFVFQIAVTAEHWRIVETQRLTHTQFERWFALRPREYSSGSSRFLGRIRSWRWTYRAEATTTRPPAP